MDVPWRTRGCSDLSSAPRTFDSLSRALNAREGSVWGGCQESGDTFCSLTLSFAQYINVPVVAAAYKRIKGVVVAFPEQFELTYATTHLAYADKEHRRWLFTFTEGGGDCPAGCTFWIKSIVRYDPRTRRTILVQRDTLGMR